MTPLLVATAVEPERDAVLAGLRETAQTPDDQVIVVGVGPIAAAAATARALAEAQAAGLRYRAVISAGIGGGFAPRVGLGDTTLATRCVAADLGADSPDGFLPLDELGFGATGYDVEAGLLVALRYALPEAVAGPVLTVSRVTGTADGTEDLLLRYPDAVAEGMEGFGVVTAAVDADLPFAEIRTISNTVGPRDRASWRIGAALAALAEVGRALGRLEP